MLNSKKGTVAKACFLAVLFMGVCCIAPVQGAQEIPVSDALKLKWFNAFYQEAEPMPRQHFLMLLADRVQASSGTQNHDLLYALFEPSADRSPISRQELMQNTLTVYPNHLFQRTSKKRFANISEKHPDAIAVDWFFRSGLNPQLWADEVSFNLSAPVTYYEALEFVGLLQELLTLDPPRNVARYILTPAPPTLDVYFKCFLVHRGSDAVVELRWLGRPDEKPMELELNLSPLGVSTVFEIFDDGTYGDRMAGDGVFTFDLPSGPAKNMSRGFDLRFELLDGSEVYGRLYLP